MANKESIKQTEDDTLTVNRDIEADEPRGGGADCLQTCREASIELDMTNYLPCVYQPPGGEPALTNGTYKNCTISESCMNQNRPRSFTATSVSSRTSTVSSVSSYFYDDSSRPPTTVLANSSSTSVTTTGEDNMREEIPWENNRASIHTDPFAPREGKTLCWRNVDMIKPSKNDAPDRKILDNVWGEVPKMETTAIMGGSGAGKTSLLNILAGRSRTNKSIRIEADVRLNNYQVDPTKIKVRKSIAFVAQDDSLQATATPREAIRFSAKLRLPRSTTDTELDRLTNRMIRELGLTACADTMVGGFLIKGISGGERKRASVGVELVVKPAMVFLDEPTSGLDSFSAVQVCQVLKKVATAGASVLFTIHQPSSEIFASFDHLILLHKGRVLFQGAVKGVPEYFGARGFPCPPNYNPADWIINVAQKNPVETLEHYGFFPEDPRPITNASIPGTGQDELGVSIHGKKLGVSKDEKPPDLKTQINMLFKRELIHMYRFPYPLYCRFGITLFLSILIGILFFEVGKESPADVFNLQSQFGALMLLLMLALLGCAQPALLFFPEERPIFLREYSTKHYSVLAYFLSRLFVEAVNTAIQVAIMVLCICPLVAFRGSLLIYFTGTYVLAMSGTAMAVLLGVLSAGNAKVAQQLLPLLFIPQLLFSGFFVSPKLIPKFLRWIQYLCVLTYSVRMLVVAEFYNCSDNSIENDSCQNLVDNVQADPDSTTTYWIVLVLYFLFFRTLALALLRKSATKFY